MKTKYLFQGLLTFTTLFCALLLLPQLVLGSESDDGMSYTHPAIDERGTYTQGGNAQWNTITNPTIKVINLNTHQYNIPIIKEITGDDNPEIIIQNNDQLSIYTRDTNDNLALITSQDVGNTQHPTLLHNIYTTPGMLRINTTHHAIITHNGTHVLEYRFNQTHLTLHASELLTQTQAPANLYPRVVCSDTTWEDDDLRCIYKFTYTNAGVSQLQYHTWNVNDSKLNSSNAHGMFSRNLNGNTDIWWVTPKITDMDLDGNIEAYITHASQTLTPPDVYVDRCVVNTTDVVCANFYFFNLPAGTDHTDYTDILINNLDGTLTNGYELSMGHSDGTNWFVRTFNHAGSVLETQYFGLVVNDIEGDYALQNLIDHPDCGIGEADAALVVHDDSDDETHIGCVSLYAGVQTDITTVTDGSEFKSHEYGISAKVTGDSTYDFLYGNVILDFSAGSIVQNYTGMDALLPVDLARIGYLDLLMLNGSVLQYYNDGLTNENVVIDSVCWSSANSVCNNTLVRFDVSITDDTDDYSTCNMQVVRASDGAVLYNASNQSGHAPVTFQYTYSFVEVGAFYVDFDCWDQYNNGSVVEYRYNLWTGMSPGCFGYNQGGNCDDSSSAADIEADEEFEDSGDAALADIGIISPKAKAFFWLLVMLAATFVTFQAVRGAGIGFGIPIAAVNIIMLVLGWVLGFIGSVILVIIGLFTALIIVFALFGRSNSSLG